MNNTIPQPPKSLFILNLLIYCGVFVFIFLYGGYTQVVPPHELIRIALAPPTVIALIMTIFFPFMLYKNVCMQYKHGKKTPMDLTGQIGLSQCIQS